ncbi:MAG TPA: tRNA lysidine(34) synthetase TilS [Bacteroidia bacterium]|nr:tRNA lysidine(34) synthetase TilS [Bacteroidia bacterium]
MFSRFTHHVHESGLFHKGQRLLLAMSGGVDSVVLAHLLKRGDFDFEIAHCNFQLRGHESLKDEKFCRKLAADLNTPVHIRKFDTKAFSLKHKLSLQLAARELRYNWFEDLLNTKGFDVLLTAHHANDSFETQLINLVRGTGLKGLRGIPQQNGRIVRPLLIFTRDDIERYAKAEKIPYREDLSNREEKYDRNFIRLRVIPLLKELNPSLEQGAIANSKRFSEEYELLHQHLESIKTMLQSEAKGLIRIQRKGLQDCVSKATVLNYLLSPFGFNGSQQKDILEAALAQGSVGKHFRSDSHLLSVDRKELVIKEHESTQTPDLNISSLGELSGLAGIQVKRIQKAKSGPPTEIALNINQLVFPLCVRPARTGDKFKPFGMKGFKLLSDYMKEQKLNHFEKQDLRLLVNGNEEIIWVLGFRNDERYRVHEGDTNLVQLSYEPKK